MIRLHFKVSWPWDFGEFKDLGSHDWIIAKTKSVEVQAWWHPKTIFEFNFVLEWSGSDHAGPSIQGTILGLGGHIILYDHRHWDYENNTWEKY